MCVYSPKQGFAADSRPPLSVARHRLFGGRLDELLLRTRRHGARLDNRKGAIDSATWTRAISPVFYWVGFPTPASNRRIRTEEDK